MVKRREFVVARDIVPDKFHLYHVGTIRLAARGLVYLGGSWLCTQDMQEFYDASSTTA